MYELTKIRNLSRENKFKVQLNWREETRCCTKMMWLMANMES